jgi:hypothetical protein
MNVTKGETELEPGTSEAAYKDNVWIETPNGPFFPHDPKINVAAAAHSLSQVNRYNGHGYFPWSVASHSVLVADLVAEELHGNPMEVYDALWHDGTEYVLADVASPLKVLLPDWRALDKTTDKAFREQLGLPTEKSKKVKVADWLALFIEAYQLMPSKAEGWEDPDGYRPWALRLRERGWGIREVSWRASREQFAAWHNKLKPETIARIEF